MTNINVRWGKFDLNDIRKMSFTEPEREKFSLQKGDLLVCEGGEVGRCAIWQAQIQPCYFQKALHRLRPKSKVVSSVYAMNYLSYAVKSHQIRALTGESSIAHFTRERFLSLLLPLPSLPEQNAIADVLECWDKAIGNYELKIEKKRNVKKGLMQRLLSGKQRLPGFEGEWQESQVARLAKVCTGSKDTKDKVPDGSYPFFVRSQKPERINTYSFDGAAVLTAGDGNIGKIFHFIDGKFDLHQRVYKISDFQPHLDARFFFEYFRMNFIHQARKYSAKTSVDSVRMEMIAKMVIPLPPLPEQKAIATVLNSADAEIVALEKKLAALKEQKRYLLNNMVVGAIRLPQFVNQGAKA